MSKGSVFASKVKQRENTEFPPLSLVLENNDYQQQLVNTIEFMLLFISKNISIGSIEIYESKRIKSTKEL